MRIRRTAAAAAVLLTVVAGCATDPEPVQVDPAPVAVDEPAKPTDVSTQSLPHPLAPFEVVATGWTEQPLEHDGIFLGIRSPEAPEEPLRFVAADSEGTVLWEAERPPSCTGFALSRAGDRPVAVLTDLESTDDAVAQTTATAYDLATGERLWGPVDVPGPHHGPGLVFSSSAPRAAVGETGPRVVLDPATGVTVRDEADQPATAVVGEYDGVVLTAADGTLTATGTDGGTRWTLPLADAGLPEGSVVTSVAGAGPPDGTALIGPAGGESGALVDLADGTVLATHVEDARRDPATGTVVTRAGSVVTGRTSAGTPWTRELDGEVRLAGVGGVLVYLRVRDAVQVLNAATGEDATVYAEGASPLGVPALFSSDGAAVLPLDEQLLVTTRPADS
ncbi:PQQ-binding-like beta-propeller repeat protein [Georgenia sp. SUBG003]|uniref:PQQ-binding-like beta-propeller repeat protein n=1 Tax=Georgenia sp. SUBG003 TaxID=1497974 RepID=UPI000694D7FF